MLGSSDPGEFVGAADCHLAWLRERKVLVGFDGFVDNIVTPVATRHGTGESFTAVETIDEFADGKIMSLSELLSLLANEKLDRLADAFPAEPTPNQPVVGPKLNF